MTKLPDTVGLGNAMRVVGAAWGWWVAIGWLAIDPACGAPAPAPPKPAAASKSAPTAAKRPDSPELLQPVDIEGSELVTKDGVALKATFFPGAKGKQSVPVILLHSWKGNRTEYVDLAVALWKAGHAVLVPDLRGHGKSRQWVSGTAELDASRFGPADFAAMVAEDMETLKNFLLRKNNAGELNLEKLCLVGADMGASVALNWALVDWSWPQYPGLKQGQYVKALVLLSPQQNFRGMKIDAALTNPILQQGVSIMILVGNEDPKLLSQAQRIHATLLRLHPTPPEEQRAKLQTLFFRALDTKAQGAALCRARILGPDGKPVDVNGLIKKFIDLRVVNQDFPWRETGKRTGSTPGK